MELCLEGSTVVYIGDHQEDVRFARNAERYFKENGYNIEIKSISVNYSGSDPESWDIQPDYIASSADEIKEVIEELRKL